RIWTSPLIRACQTADIMSQSLQPAAIRTDCYIGDGDLSGLYEELKALPEMDTLLIVGHQPYLDRWTEAWTGSPAGFKTASMALVSYDPYDGNFGKGKLLLYLHPAGARLFLGQAAQ
ncbi:MAG TPA: phosphoglycerate mutase, partial [Megasphaera sp.]|nr:phosphoglycerate mutase [Megasphaera sp.]